MALGEHRDLNIKPISCHCKEKEKRDLNTLVQTVLERSRGVVLMAKVELVALKQPLTTILASLDTPSRVMLPSIRFTSPMTSNELVGLTTRLDPGPTLTLPSTEIFASASMRRVESRVRTTVESTAVPLRDTVLFAVTERVPLTQLGREPHESGKKREVTGKKWWHKERDHTAGAKVTILSIQGRRASARINGVHCRRISTAKFHSI